MLMQVKQNTFDSRFERCSMVTLPPFSGVRIQVMPVRLGDMDSIPPSVDGHSLVPYLEVVEQLFADCHRKDGIGYLTIDEREVKKGETHRQAGPHVDGALMELDASRSMWGACETLTVSNIAACRAWQQRGIVGKPGDDGECGHLVGQLQPENAYVLDANTIFWMAALCVHESMPLLEDGWRQFVRLTVPFHHSVDVWFEGYTENPLGVQPGGLILPRRPQMG